MDSGLKENFPDRMSPIKAHIDGLKSLGSETGPLNPYINAVTSDVVRVRILKDSHSCPCLVQWPSRCLPVLHKSTATSTGPRQSTLPRLPARTELREHRIPGPPFR